MFLIDGVDDNVKTLAKYIKESKCVSVITGAGVSKESGIPTFRGEGGIYSSKFNGYSPEYLMSVMGLVDNNELFREFFGEVVLKEDMDYKPNKTHEILARLESKNLIRGVITQNIDTLHQDAGTKTVIPIHGTLGKYYCSRCKQLYSKEDFLKEGYCDCGGFIRPDITLYGDKLNANVYSKALDLAYKSDLIIVIGSSLLVNTATDLLQFLDVNKDGKLVIINIGETAYDDNADLLFNTGESCSSILERLEGLL